MQALRRSIRWSLLLLAVSMTGCATLRTPTAKQAVAEAGQKADEPPTCTLLHKGKNDRVRAAKIPLDGMVTIGRMLEEHELLGRRSKVTIYRKTADSAKPVRLEIELDGRKVREEFNYVIHPDDQIVIGRDDSTPIDSLMSYLGPLGRR